MLSILSYLIILAVKLYKLLVVIYFILKLLKVPANKWTALLDSVIEPVLNPIRKLVNQHLPQKWQIIDWSPVALFLVITVVQWLL